MVEFIPVVTEKMNVTGERIDKYLLNIQYIRTPMQRLKPQKIRSNPVLEFQCFQVGP